MDHDQRVCTGWRMDRTCQKHEGQSENKGEHVNPRRVAEELEANNPNESTPEMAAEQRTGLSSRRARESEKEHGRAAERGNEQRFGWWFNQPKDKAESCCRTH
jgi:hypothetical protein